MALAGAVGGSADGAILDSVTGIDALTRAFDGTRNVPESDDDWRDWVSPTAMRAYLSDDPLLDWLELYGSDHGFQRDDELPGYDSRTDFGLFIMRKGREFEEAVVEHLGTLARVHAAASPREGSRDLGSAERTFAAMRRGEELIHQAVLRDAETRTYGTADLLIRSDVLRDLFPGAITDGDGRMPAPALGSVTWHYRVVDIKFTTLHLLAGGGLRDTGSSWRYKLQVHVYNRALGRLQGHQPHEAYLLGRGWERTRKGEKLRATSCMDVLGPVPQEYVSRSKGTVAAAVEEACSWLRRVRSEGAEWQVLPEPTVPELRPNMGNGTDAPWHTAKQQIGEQLEEPTMLWHVGIKGRESARRSGVARWRSDPAFTTDLAGVTGLTIAPTLEAILDINRSIDGPPVLPSTVHAGEVDWRPEPTLELYVDFETVSDLDDDFKGIPEKGGQPLIFMIGCGHVEDGEWRWSCFTANALTEQAEGDMIDAWFAHMDALTRWLGSAEVPPNVFHWSHAEASTLETAFNSAMKRHPEKGWRSPRWYDLLNRVVKKEPMVVRGALGFGLKAVARALRSHGLINTRWDAGVSDGLGAMAGAWVCAREAADRGRTLAETELMTEIGRYNEVDCKVMMEIVRYLRAHH
jgi:hypothetical protein